VYPISVPLGLYNELEGVEFSYRMDLDAYNSYYCEVYQATDELSDGTLYSQTNIGSLFCDPTCMMKDDTGRILYFDAHHLTLSGARHLEPVIYEVIHEFELRA